VKRKRTPRWFAPVAILFVAAAAFFLPKLFRDLGERIPMKIREFHVQGAKVLSTVDLKSMAGLHEGSPLFGNWSRDAVEKVKQHPRVERVAVARDVTGKVFVKVSERKAAAMVNLDRLYFVDREGNVLDVADPRSPDAADLVVFTGPWRKVPAVGLKEEVVNGFELRDAMAAAGFEVKGISELHFEPSLGWVVYLVGSSPRIVVGKGEFLEKAKRLERVLRDYQGKEGTVKEIDLSFRDRAIVKVKSAG
jgi:hypothetical protein